MKSDPAKRVAENVRVEFARQNIQQAQASQALNLSQSAFSRRFRGYVEFSASEIQIIADLLKVPVTELLSAPAVKTAQSPVPA